MGKHSSALKSKRILILNRNAAWRMTRYRESPYNGLIPVLECRGNWDVFHQLKKSPKADRKHGYSVDGFDLLGALKKKMFENINF
jgi:hypothetical protein